MKLTDQSIIKFGRYKGRKLINVPPSYLLKLIENDIGEPKHFIYYQLADVQLYVKENLETIKLLEKWKSEPDLYKNKK